MIIIGFLDSTLEEGLDVQAEGTDGGKRNRELHTDGPTQTHMHPFTWRIHTFLQLAVSSSSLFLLFSTLCIHLSQHATIKNLHLLSELEVSCEKKQREGESKRDRMYGRDMGVQARG